MLWCVPVTVTVMLPLLLPQVAFVALAVALGPFVLFTVALAVVVQPFASVIVTVYVPAGIFVRF
ncbi:MAG: hypothetical protein IPN09_07645 [Bacteroidetes bacterium]|nr:hypothetical protein [Bacteroidota bacterium]